MSTWLGCDVQPPQELLQANPWIQNWHGDGHPDAGPCQHGEAWVWPLAAFFRGMWKTSCKIHVKDWGTMGIHMFWWSNRTRTADRKRYTNPSSKICQASPSKLPHLGRAFTDIQEQKQAPCRLNSPKLFSGSPSFAPLFVIRTTESKFTMVPFNLFPWSWISHSGCWGHGLHPEDFGSLFCGLNQVANLDWHARIRWVLCIVGRGG